MKFNVIGPDGQPKMGTDTISCVYELGVLKGMEDAGYTFTVNGKKVKAANVHQAMRGADDSVKVPKSIIKQKDPAYDPPYTVDWSMCKRKRSYDDIERKFKEFQSRDSAIEFLVNKSTNQGYYAGGSVSDASGIVVFEQDAVLDN